MKRILAAVITAAVIIGSFPMGIITRAAAPEEKLISMKFDLGGKGTASGYIGVSASDKYDEKKGYGIGDIKLASNVDAGGSGALSDAVQFEGANASLCVDLPKGVYKITVTTGNNQSVNINAEGYNQLFFLTGNNATDSFTIPVTDGQLNIHASRGMGEARSLSTVEIEQMPYETTKPIIWLGGDSTVANSYNAPEGTRRGWGEYLPKYVDMDTYDIRNLSASGLDAAGLRSSLFPTAEYYGKEGDILLLSVGINDYSTEYSKHRDDPSKIDPSSYVSNITDMVRRAKAKGMKVYLVKQHGTGGDTGRYPLPTHAWFGKQLDQIAASEKVETIDLFRPWLQMLLVNVFYEKIDYYAPGSSVEIIALGADKLAEMVYKQLFNIEEPGPGHFDPYTGFEENATAIYETKESGKPVKNPHKGCVITAYTPDMINGQYKYGYGGSANNPAWNVSTIVSGSPHWEDLNPAEGVYDWSEIDDMLDACEKAGLTYGIRIMPYSSYLGEDFVPDWVYAKGAKKTTVERTDKPGEMITFPTWDDPVYLAACKKFATALAEKYDGDPRVEFIDVRPFGDYGEWHTAFTSGNYMPSIEIQKDMLDHYRSAFKKTLLALPSDGWGEIYQYALSIGITKRDDGLVATPNIEWSTVPTYKANMPVLGENLWPIDMMQNYVRETDFSYINWSPERFRETIEISHLSIFALDQDSECSHKFYENQQPVIDEMCNRLGYNFTVTSATRSGNQLKVTVKNTGLASNFFNIDLAAEITDEKGNKIGNFGSPVRIGKSAFRDGEERAYLFTCDGEVPADASICLAMYDADRLGSTHPKIVKSEDPTVRFDNKNTLPNGRLLLVPTWTAPVDEPTPLDGKILKFDLGGRGTASGYIGVSASDKYTAEKGYGIGQTNLAKDVEAPGAGALSDAIHFVGGYGNLQVDLEPGVYKITVTTGNIGKAIINAEGVEQLLFMEGFAATDSFTIPVTDGQLNIYASSGVGSEWSLCTVEIEQVSTGTATRPTIWLCGDSTVCTYYNTDKLENPQRGWGEYLHNYVDTDKYDIRNISISGCRTQDMVDKYFKVIEKYGKAGDILVLSHGINDYGDEYRDYTSNGDPIDAGKYITNMKNLIERAKARGMEVYVVKENGDVSDAGYYPVLTKKYFSDELDALAASENVKVIDLFRPWLEILLSRTQAIAKNYYCKEGGVHPNATGADMMAEIVASQLFPKAKAWPTYSDPYPDFDASAEEIYQTELAGEPVKNPHKGFVNTVYNPLMLYEGQHPNGIGGSNNNHSWDVVTIVSDVLFWKDLNPEEGVYDFSKIDEMLRACEQADMTYGLRIVPFTTSNTDDESDYGARHNFVPQWVYDKGAKQDLVNYTRKGETFKIKVPNWSDPTYIKYYKEFISALAKKYNGDPRLEYMEIRAFGNMGEWHTGEFDGNDLPSVEVQKDMFDFIASKFTKTTCSVFCDARELYDYTDSLGFAKRNNGLIKTKNTEWELVQAYKDNVMTMADNWGPYSNMKNVDTSKGDLRWSKDRFRESIEIPHLSIYALDQDGTGSANFYSEQKTIIDEMCNRLGYDFSVTSAKRSGNQLKVVIENKGVAPAFFDIRLCAEITDADGNKIENFGEPVLIKKGAFHDGDIRAYLFTYKGELPEDATICLAMYDVNNKLAMAKADPTVRFDNKNNLPTNRLKLVSTWSAPVETYGVTVHGGTAQKTSGTAGSAANVISAPAGSTITLTAGKAAAGKEFDKWVVNSGSVRLTNASSETATFKMPAEAVEVTATYKDIVYSIKVNSGTADKKTAIAGETVTITAAEPEAGKEFDKWVIRSGSVTLSSASTSKATFKMIAGDVEVTATYKDIPVTKYSVTVNGGSSDKAEAAAGEKITLTADAPAEGKEFDKWVVNTGAVRLSDDGASTATFTMPSGDVEVTATYRNIPPKKYVVTVHGGSSDKAEAAAGETVVITAAAPEEGEEFDKWIVDSGEIKITDESASIASFVMPEGSVSVTATYKAAYVPPTVYAVTVHGGSSDKDQAAEGETVALTAAAPEEGKEFDKWVVNSGEVKISDTSASVTSFVMPEGDVEVTATYKNIPPKEYKVTVNSGAASVASGSASSELAAKAGETVTLTAEAPAEGKEFDKWVIQSGSVTLSDETSGTASFTMPAEDVEVTATYKTIPPKEYLVTVNSGAADKEMVASGENVIITADEPEPGKEFDKWVVEYGEIVLSDDSSNVTSFVMPEGDVEISATYKDAVSVTTYNITVNSGSSDKTSATAGGTVTIKAAKAEDGKEFDKWEVKRGGIVLLEENKEETSFTMPSSDVEITATYKDLPVQQEPKPIRTISFDLGGGTLAGRTGVIEIEAEEGSTIIVPAAPTKEGFIFRYWKGSEYYPGDTYVVSGDHTLTAVFEVDTSNEVIPPPLVRPDNGTGSQGESQIGSHGVSQGMVSGNQGRGSVIADPPLNGQEPVTGTNPTVDKAAVNDPAEANAGDPLPSVDAAPSTEQAPATENTPSTDPVPKTGDISAEIEFPRWTLIVILMAIGIVCCIKLKKISGKKD